MTAGYAVVLRARLAAGAQGAAGSVRWRSSAAARQRTRHRLAVSADLIAADHAADDARSLEIADVIYRREVAANPPASAWLTETLDRYPGCSAAAIPTAGCRFLIAPRGNRPFIFSLLMPNEHSFNVLLGAIFVHGWLCAGWPLATLDPPRLDVAGTFRPAGPTPISLRLYYSGLLPRAVSCGGLSSPSRRRMAPASGASIPE
jgi:hypothetical protein